VGKVPEEEAKCKKRAEKTPATGDAKKFYEKPEKSDWRKGQINLNSMLRPGLAMGEGAKKEKKNLGLNIVRKTSAK